jgi:hypothetical protein
MRNAVILAGLITNSPIAWGDDVSVTDKVARRIAEVKPDPNIQNGVVPGTPYRILRTG